MMRTSARLKVLVGSALLVSTLLGAARQDPAAQTGNPWDSAAGQACFEQWIQEAMARLNAYEGTDELNSRKPWSINQHGMLEGNARYGPRASGPPSDYADCGSNKYWWMWEHYTVVPETGWRSPDWNGAAIPPLRDYVRDCLAKTMGHDAEPSVRMVTVQVRADQAWTRSGLQLAAGEIMRIEATGQVDAAPPDDARALFHQVPPEGRAEFLPQVPQPLLPALMLLGRIGDGPVLPIGKLVERLQVGAPYGTGEMMLGINDDVLTDNAGAWMVTITVREPD